jgi:hypothetical protein
VFSGPVLLSESWKKQFWFANSQIWILTLILRVCQAPPPKNCFGKPNVSAVPPLFPFPGFPALLFLFPDFSRILLLFSRQDSAFGGIARRPQGRYFFHSSCSCPIYVAKVAKKEDLL